MYWAVVAMGWSFLYHCTEVGPGLPPIALQLRVTEAPSLTGELNPLMETASMGPVMEGQVIGNDD